MHTLPLLVQPAEAPGDITVDYRAVLRDVVRRPLNTQTGMQVDEMRRSIRVLDALDSANGVLELEDADWDHLKEKVMAMPWAVADRRILDLVEHFVGP